MQTIKVNAGGWISASDPTGTPYRIRYVSVQEVEGRFLYLRYYRETDIGGLINRELVAAKSIGTAPIRSRVPTMRRAA